MLECVIHSTKIEYHRLFPLVSDRNHDPGPLYCNRNGKPLKRVSPSFHHSLHHPSSITKTIVGGVKARGESGSLACLLLGRDSQRPAHQRHAVLVGSWRRWSWRHWPHLMAALALAKMVASPEASALSGPCSAVASWLRPGCAGGRGEGVERGRKGYGPVAYVESEAAAANFELEAVALPPTSSQRLLPSRRR